jgi:phosphoribosylformimino-5-aminoimidazole carboxamide ribotide isomerase
MLIYPALDLMGSRVVRLRKGRFDDATVYDSDPAARLASYATAGATWAHIVDLDGARAGQPQQHELIGCLAGAHAIRIQAGGGVREREHIASLLTRGASRVVIGSVAVQQSANVRNWLAEFGMERICLALDVNARDGTRLVAVKGWTELSELSLRDALALYPPGTARHVLVTDVSRDGMMRGPDCELIRSIAAARPDLDIQASGGIASLADLARLKAAGAAGAIVGRALFEGAFGLEEALHAG